MRERERERVNSSRLKSKSSLAKTFVILFLVLLSFGVHVDKAQAAQITVYATANSIKWMGTNNGWNTNPDGVSGTYYSNPQNDSNNTFIVDLNGKTLIDTDTDIVVDKIQDSANGSLSVTSARTITVLNGGIYYSGNGTSGMITSNVSTVINGAVTNAGTSGRAIMNNSGTLTINAGVGNTAVINQSTSYAVQNNSTGQVTVIGKVNGRSTGPAIYISSSSNVALYNPGNDVFSDAGATTGGRQLQNSSGSIIAVGNMNGSASNGSNVEMIRSDGGTFELIGNVTITGSAVRGIWNRTGSVSHVYGNIDLSGVVSGTSYGFYNQSTTTNNTVTGNVSNPGGSPTATAAFSSAGMVTIYGTKSGSGTVNSATFTTVATSYVSVSPTILPAGATGYLNASITGVGTSWNGSETPSITNSVSGNTAVSVGSWTSSDGTHGTLPLQNSATSSFGTFSVTIGTTTSGPLAVLPASFILSQTTGVTSNSYNLTLTGISTAWALDIAKGNHSASNLFSASTGGIISNVVISNNNTATLTLTTDATQRVITITDNSTNQTSTFNTNTILTYDLNPGVGIANNYVMIEGGMRWDGGRWYTTAPTSGVGIPLGAIHFVGKLNKIEGYIYKGGSVVVLNVDGVDTATYTTPGGATNVWQTMFTGLDETTAHTYTLIWATGQIAVNGTIGKIRTTGGAGISTTTLVARPVLAIMGDSITQGGAYESPSNSTLYYAYLLAKKLNYQIVNMGLSGTTVSSYLHGGFNPTTSNGVGRTGDITGLTPPASIVVVLYGTNDTSHTYTPAEADFRTDYTSMLAGIRSGNTHALIIAERLMHVGDPTVDPKKDTFSQTDIAAAVSAQADAKILYMHGAYDSYSGSDGVHPAPAENSAIANGIYSDIISAISTTNSIKVATTTLSSRGGTSATITSAGGIYGTAPYTYQWIRSATSSWSGTQIAGATGTTLNDTGLNPLSTYYYTLQTTDSYGLSVLSNQVTVGPASNDANLSDLTLSQGTLSPTFSSSTTSYTANVLNGVTSLTVTPTASQAGSTITVNGSPVTSGSSSSPIALNVGANTVLTVTLAQDASTTKTYTITVTRATPIVVPPTVTVQSASSVATSTAIFNGTITVDGYASSTIIGFNYGTTLSYGSIASTTGTFGVGSFSKTILGLSPNTLYHYQAFAQNSAGVGTSSDATTTTSALPDLTLPQLTSITANPNSSSATITWTTDKLSSSKVNYGLTSTLNNSTPEIDTSTRVQSHSVTISNLVSCTTYHYSVYSADALANTATSSDATFTTSGCSGNTSLIGQTNQGITTNGTATLTTDTGKNFIVNLPTGFSSTTSNVVVQIKSLDSSSVINSLGSPSASLRGVGSVAFDVKALVNSTTTLDSFSTPVTITYQYSDADISGFNESTLWMYHYHNGVWSALDNCQINTGTKTITCTAPSFSVFSLFAQRVQELTSTPTLSPAQASYSSGGGGTVYGCKDSNAINYNYFSRSKPELCQYGISANTTSFKKPVFARDLKLKDTGADVKLLQQFLNTHGFPLAKNGVGSKGKENTIFGPATKAALIKFQKANKIPATGFFGVKTRGVVVEK